MLTPSIAEIEPLQETRHQVRPALLLMVYACMPGPNGEACAGWTRVIEAAREFDVHAIVGPESYAALEERRLTHPIPRGVHFHTPKLDLLWGLLRRIPGGNHRHPATYRHWQRLAYKLALDLHRRHCFSLVHQLNLGTFSEPGHGWRLGIPYVWGPAGGTELLPPEFLAGLPLVEQLSERLREVNIRRALRSTRVRRAAARAAKLLAANTAAQRDFERAFRRPVELVPECAIHTVRRPETARFRGRGPLNLLWSGDLKHPGGLPLLLEAVANLGHDVDYQLNIVGAGPKEAEWKSLATEMGVRRRCTFHGELDWPAFCARLDWAHLYVFTSLRNASATPVLEALGRGVPVMCFDQHSAGDLVTPACGIKVPITHPGHAIAAMASAIRQLAQDRTPLLQLSAGACDRAQNYLWREDSARLQAIYRSLALADRSPAQLL